jgi:trimeric autotransporter adhesin
MANRFFVNGGVDNNWGTTGNWSLSSGGAGGEAVPTSSDDVFLDGSSPNCTVNASARVAKTLICTGYTNTLTMSQNITVSGNITLVAAMSFSGTAKLRCGTAATLTSNGKTFTGGLDLFGAVTITLADNWTIQGTATLGNGTNTTTINSNTLNVGGGLTVDTTTGLVAGTTTIVLNGTGTWSNPNLTTGALRSNLTFNTAGTITVSTTVRYNTGTITYTAGTMSLASSDLILSANCSMATNGMTWEEVTVGGSTITLSNNLQTTKLDLTTSGTATFNSNTLSCTNLAATTPTLAGSSNITVTDGTVSGTSLTVNKTNTLTFAGTITWTLTTFTRTAGTVTTTDSTLVINGSRTFAGATTWNNWTVTGTATLTLDALQTLAGILALEASTTFAGTNAWTAFHLSLRGAGFTHQLVSSRTYNISANGFFTGTATTGSHTLLRSVTGGTRTVLTLAAGVGINLYYIDGTDIDSSAGLAVGTKGGALSNNLNWTVLPVAPTVAAGFII